jgi:hypothetical protein
VQPLGELFDVAVAAVWRASWQAVVLAAIVLALQLVLGGRLAAKWRFALWSVVMLRLLIPTLPASPMSLFNLSPQLCAEAAPGSVGGPKPFGPPCSSGAIGVDLRQRGSSAVPLHPSAHVTAGPEQSSVAADGQRGPTYRDDATAIRNKWCPARLAGAVWLAGVLIFAGMDRRC